MIDLQGSEGSRSLHIPERIWGVMLNMAHQREWSPLGPDMPGQRRIEDPNRYHGKDWRPDYCVPEGQYVTETDAHNLSEALERFLPEIPDEDEPGESGEDRTCLSSLPVTPYELFRGEGKNLIKELIEFCHQGGFFINGSGLGSTMGSEGD